MSNEKNDNILQTFTQKKEKENMKKWETEIIKKRKI